MKDGKPTRTEWGMMAGIVAGSAIAAVMFALTTNPLWFGVIGIGVALGLAIGAGSET